MTKSADTQYAGGTITITATPASAAYLFDSWTITPNYGTITSVSANTYTYNIIDTNVTITANFKIKPPTIWYVATNGNDNNSGTSVITPFVTIAKAMSSATEGDTIMLAAGTYAETVVIDKNNISLIGADSATTIIDPVGDSGVENLYGIYATGKTNLYISRLRITDCYYGVYYNNIDTSIIENITVEKCGNSNRAGINIYNGSCSNIIQNCYLNNNYNGIYLNTNSNNNLLSRNVSSSNSRCGIYMNSNSNTNTLNANITNSNTQYGIYLYTSSYNTISGNTASSNLNHGIFLFSGSNNNVLDGNTANSNSQYGIYLNTNSNGNTLSGNTANSNSQYGIYLNTTSNNNTLSNNTTNSNTNQGIFLNSSNSNILSGNTSNYNLLFGIYLSVSSNNTLSGNTANLNLNRGIYIALNSDSNILRANIVNSNSQQGIYIYSSSNNLVIQNDIRQNTGYQILIGGTSAADTILKNNIMTSGINADSAIFNDANATLDLSENYWNTTDSSIISRSIYKTNGVINWSPFYFSQIDTTAGADTVAPGAVTITSIDTTTSAGTATIRWTNPTYSGVGSSGLAGFNIFRAKSSELANGDTGNWYAKKIATVYGSDTVFVDTAVETFQSYYYRVTAFDSHLTNGTVYYNESWYSNSAFSGTIPLGPHTGKYWYVSSDTGNNIDYNGMSYAPFKTIAKAMSVVSSGDTICIAVGSYSEDITISQNNISIIGAGSSGDSTAISGKVTASNKSNILIDKISILNVLTANGDGINFTNISNPRITNSKIYNVKRYGIYIDSCTNAYLFNNTLDSIPYHTIYVTGTSSVSSIDSNLLINCRYYGIYIDNNANTNSITNNKVLNNRYSAMIINSKCNTIGNNYIYNVYNSYSGEGNGISIYGDSGYVYNNICDSIYSAAILVNANNILVDSNLVQGVMGSGITIGNDKDSNSITNNILLNIAIKVSAAAISTGAGSDSTIISGNNIYNISGSADGIIIYNGYNNYCYNNIIDSVAQRGISVSFFSDYTNNIIDSNLIKNVNYGIEVSKFDLGFITRNRIINCKYNGIKFTSNSDSNIVANNYIYNTWYSNAPGIYLNGSVKNYFSMNTIDSTAGYGFSLQGASAGNSFVNNNWLPSTGNQNNAVSNNADAFFDFTNNYWLSTDSSVIANKMKGTYANKIMWQPYRFSFADTAEGADTVAPSTPNITGLDTSVVGQITVKWDSPAYSGAGSQGLAGFHIFRAPAARLTNGDTNNWYSYLAKTVSSSETSWVDNTIDSKTMYFYRVTAFDSHLTNGQTYYNESWYSTARSCSSPYNGPMWYVNAATGSDTQNEGSGNSPYKTINKALSVVSAGDTIMLAAGTYSETFIINQNNLSIIGVDSTTTFLNAIDSSSFNYNGIYADTQTGLLLKNFQIYNAGVGVKFYNVDNSRIENVRIRNCKRAIGLYTGSDSNNLNNNYTEYNSDAGLYLSSSSYNTITNNKSRYNSFFGYYIADSGAYNVLTNNEASNNNQHGFYFITSPHYNTISGNISSYNSFSGFYFCEYSYNNTITGNTSSYNTQSGYVFEYASNNIMTNNTALGNGQKGIYLYDNAINNTVSNNNVRNNQDGIFVWIGSNNTISVNKISNNIKNGIFVRNANNNYFKLNTVDSNAEYAVYLQYDCSNDTFEKNNFYAGFSNPDSIVYYGLNNNKSLDFYNNYWNTTDSSFVKNKIYGTSTKINYTPFLFGAVDTAVGADTMAPGVVSITSYDTSVMYRITLNWTASSYASGSAGGDGLAGYNIFRATDTQQVNGDTNNWYLLKKATVNHNTTNWTDTDVTITDTYYYHVTAFDKHTTNGTEYRNESWYSPVLQAIPMRNRAPQLILPVSAMTAYEDTAVFTLTFTSGNIKDSDVNDTIGNITLSAYDTELTRISVANNGTSQIASFYVLPDTFGTDTFIFKLTDAAGTSDSKVFVLTILNVNDTPNLNLSVQSVTVNEDTVPWTMQLTNSNISDSDPADTIGTMAISVSDTEKVKAAVVNNGSGHTITFEVLKDAVGTDTVAIRATDASGAYNEKLYVVNITNQNDAPNLTLTNNDTTVLEDCQPFYIDITSSNVSDTDAADTIGTMTVSVSDTQLVKAIVSNNGTFHRITFSVLADTFGADTVTVRVTDSSAGYSEKPFVITILNVNDTPNLTLSNSAITVEEDTPAWTMIISGSNISDRDPADTIGTMTITVSDTEKVKASVVNNGTSHTITFELLKDAVGTDTVTIRATDKGGAYNEKSYAVNITNLNDAPNLTLTNNDTTVLEDCQPFYIDITSSNVSDTDAADTISTMTVSVSDTQLVKAIVSNNGTFHRITFSVLADTFGADTVTVRVTDSSAGYSEKPFVITILNVNDTPNLTLSNSAITVEEDTPAWTMIISGSNISDRDPADTIGTMTITVSDTEKVKASVVNNGTSHTITFELLKDAVGTDTVTIRATDKGGAYNEK
ncbi:MAG TPA: right-handed parallel beta-helix repeat-containing protein, partial [bacterium]|nr:right-handed parallel beta-helix repeat-containing protein [bacterium]